MAKFALRFRAVNKDIFEALRKGTKKIETRAGSPRYLGIQAGDVLVFVCGKNSFSKKVKSVRKFKSVKALHRVYKPVAINPKIRTVSESEQMYYSFPGYREKIKKYGILAFEL